MTLLHTLLEFLPLIAGMAFVACALALAMYGFEINIKIGGKK